MRRSLFSCLFFLVVPVILQTNFSCSCRNLVVNKAMISEKVLQQRNEERKRRAWKYTVIRVLFPDKTVLQGTFYSVEKGTKNGITLQVPLFLKD